MQITLYAQDKLNISYIGAFYNTELLNGYLDKVAVKYTFNIDDFYPLFNDTVFLSGYANNIIELVQLNYIKFSPEETDENKNTFYAFIDDIEMRNEGFMISYTIDVYHSFLPPGGYTLTHSVLNSTMYPNEYKSDIRYTLPVGYAQNGLLFPALFPDYASYKGNINLIAKIQLYNLDEAGKSNGVQTLFVGVTGVEKIEDNKGNITVKPQSTLKRFTLDDAYRACNIISKYMSVHNSWHGTFILDIATPYYYRVENIYAVPAGILDNKGQSTIVSDTTYTILDSAYFAIALCKLISTGANYYNLAERTITNTDGNYFKYTGVGLFNYIVPFDNTLKENKIAFAYQTNGLILHFYLIVNNIFTDITDYFICDLLFNVTDAAAMQLQQMHKTIAENNAKAAQLDFITSITDIGYETVKGAGNVLSEQATGVKQILNGNYLGAFGTGAKIISTKAGALQKITHAINSAAQAKIEQKNYEIRANQKYINWSNTSQRQGGFVNAMWGFILQLGVEAVDGEINESIKQYGYTILNGYNIEKIKDLRNKQTIDYVQFKEANVINLTGEYSDIIEQILEKGLYVYYTS